MVLFELVICGNIEIVVYDICIVVKKLVVVNFKIKMLGLVFEYQVGIVNILKYEEYRNVVVCLCVICIVCVRNGVLMLYVFLGLLEVFVSE